VIFPRYERTVKLDVSRNNGTLQRHRYYRQ